MIADYGVHESVITGTQADVKWFAAPIRYAKEDGSDGVVRVSGANVNFHYVRLGPAQEALAWQPELPRRLPLAFVSSSFTCATPLGPDS
jgi:hypothetical protein